MKEWVVENLFELGICAALLWLIFAGQGCAERACPPCPSAAAIIGIPTPWGPQGVRIREGFFDDADNWYTEEQYEKLRKQSQGDEKPKPEIAPPDVQL